MLKKGRSFAAKRFLLGGWGADELSLTESQSCGTSWSEVIPADVSSTTDVLHDARGDHLENEAVRPGVWKASRHASTSASSIATSVEEDGSHAFSSTRGLSQMPRLYKWSPKSMVQLSIVVVALAVAVVVTLVFTLRDKENSKPEHGGDHRYSGFKVESSAKGTSPTAVTRHYHLPAAVSGRHHIQSNDARPKQAALPSPFGSQDGDNSTWSAHEGSQAVTRFSGVVWGNDAGFEPTRFLFPAPDPKLKHHEGRHDSRDEHDKKASKAEKSTQGVSSPSSNKGAPDEFDRREKRLQRMNRKAYLKNTELRLLHKN